MKPEQTKTVKLSNLAKAIALTLALPTTAMAAFPELEGDFIQHINHPTTPGVNLIVNPTLDVCIKDIPDEVFTSNPDSACTTKGDFKWGWVGPTDIDKAAENKTLITTGNNVKPVFDETAGSNGLKATISVVGASKLYIKFRAKVSEATEAKLQVLMQKKGTGEYDGGNGYVVLQKLPSAITDWAEYSAEVTISSNAYTVPYSNTIQFNIGGNGSGKEFDDITFFTDVELANYVPINDAPDADGDGFSDDDENAVFSDPNDIDITPLNADNDDDGYLNTEEIEAGTDHEDPFDNPGSVDTDGDGYFDAEEVAEGSDVNDITKTPIDLDGDGVLNSLLSSGSIANGNDKFPENMAASMDSDDDGYPDEFNAACEQACQDASGLVIDGFPFEDAAHLDADNDGLADACLVELVGDAPASPELDGSQTCGLTAVDVDYDNDADGFKNEEEILGGSNPNDAESIPTDPDSDGWDNDVDQYPTLNLFSQPTTNLLLAHGFDAESNTSEWTHTASTTVEQTTDKNGETTAAFKIVAESGETRYEGPLLEIAEEKDARAFRIGAWIKIEDSTERAALDVLDRIFIRVGVKYHDADIKGGAFPGYYANQNSDDNKAKLVEVYATEENNGWLYVESQSLLSGAVKSIAPNLLFKTKAAGPVTLWVDNLELNFAENGDADAATDIEVMINASDADDDNDGIKDGLDESPLGDAGTDLDADGIWDAYDDDHDNDQIANVIDDDFTPLLLGELTVTEGEGTYTITANAVDADDENITYRWTIFTTDIADNGSYTAEETELSESGNSITLNVADYPSGFQVPVIATAVTSVDSLPKQTVVAMPGDKLNFVPQIADAEPVSNNLDDTISLTADIFDFDEEDAITYSWTVNGNAVDFANTDVVINNADFAPGSELIVVLTASDGKDTATKTWNVITNQLPEVNIAQTVVDADVTTFSVGYEDTEGNLVLGVQDVEGDSFTYLWSMIIDGADYILEETDANGREFSIDRFEFQASSVIELTITVTDMNRPTHVVTQTVSHTLDAIVTENNEDEIYPEGEDGGATWWLLALLVPAFIRRRFNK